MKLQNELYETKTKLKYWQQKKHKLLNDPYPNEHTAYNLIICKVTIEELLTQLHSLRKQLRTHKETNDNPIEEPITEFKLKCIKSTTTAAQLLHNKTPH